MMENRQTLLSEQQKQSIGILNVADSYYAAAVCLADARLPTTHESHPTHFLFHQTIELYLKAFLRLRGRTDKESWGHKLVPLYERASKKGLKSEQFDVDTFELFDRHKITENRRYLRTGYFENFPETARMMKTCASIRAQVADCFKADGVPVRPSPLTYALNKNDRH